MTERLSLTLTQKSIKSKVQRKTWIIKKPQTWNYSSCHISKFQHKGLFTYSIINCWQSTTTMASQVALVVKSLPPVQETWETRFNPWVGKSPGGGNGKPFQYSCLENPMDRGNWWARVHGVAKSWTQLSDWACMYTSYLWRWDKYRSIDGRT